MSREVASLLASLPAGPWRDAALAWAARFGADLGAAWADCPRGSWLLWLAGRAAVDDHQLTLAAADCAGAALELTPELGPTLVPALDRLTAWARGAATADEAANAVASAFGLASRHGMLAKGATGEERRRLLALSLVARAVARVGEGRVGPGSPRPPSWPTAADLAAAAAAAGTSREREDVARAIMEARCAELVRARIPAALVLGREPVAVGPAALTAAASARCYVEVCISDERRWQALCELWYEAARAKETGTLEVDDPAWDAALAPAAPNVAEARDALDSLRGGDYRLAPPRRLDDFTGRLEVEPGAVPFGGLGPAAWLAEAFGLAVVAFDEGAGRREGGPGAA
ncbi:MAG TPA: hypothetical protein VGQ83_10675 [Polyangia bacterium]